MNTAGIGVTWTKSNPNGTFATATITTNASGIATVILTTPTVAGTATTVTATSSGNITGTSPTITTTAAGPTAKYIVTSSNYSPLVGAKGQQIIFNSFEVKVSPNPSNTDFKLTVQSNSSEPISIRLVNVSGRVMNTNNNIQNNESVSVGGSLTRGTYIAEVTQGRNKKMIKLIKF